MGDDILAHSPINIALLEMHNLAYFYHWDRDSVWHIPCTERAVWNRNITRQLKAENGESNNSDNTPNSSYKESI